MILTRDPLAACAIAAAGLAVSLTPRLTARVALPGVATPALRDAPARRALYALLPPSGAHPLAARLVAELAAAAACGFPRRPGHGNTCSISCAACHRTDVCLRVGLRA